MGLSEGQPVELVLLHELDECVGFACLQHACGVPKTSSREPVRGELYVVLVPALLIGFGDMCFEPMGSSVGSGSGVMPFLPCLPVWWAVRCQCEGGWVWMGSEGLCV